VLQLLLVVFSFQPDPMRLLNLNTELLHGRAHGIKDLIGEVLIPLLVNKDPLVLLEVDRILDGQLPESSFIAADNLVAPEDLRRAEDVSAHGLRVSFELEAPVLDALLVEKLLHHLANLLDLILGSDSGLSQSIAHASAFPHFV